MADLKTDSMGEPDPPNELYARPASILVERKKSVVAPSKNSGGVTLIKKIRRDKGEDPGTVTVEEEEPVPYALEKGLSKTVTSSTEGGAIPSKTVVGPCLRFGGWDPNTKEYTGSVLVVAHQSKTPQPPEMVMQESSSNKIDPVIVKGSHLDHYKGYNFWRFDIITSTGDDERSFEYKVQVGNTELTKPSKFSIPGSRQMWRWGFYSCNGFHDPVEEEKWGGIQPLWEDVLVQQATAPLHVMVGGGDQLYCDHVWELPSLLKWLEIVNKEQRLGWPFEAQMAVEVEDFYFQSYLDHWSKDKFSTAMAMIPQIMTWDDHDIFDGWGSYPTDLQTCKVFKGIFFFAKKYYTLFQQHSTPERIVKENKVFGAHEGWHHVTCMGHSLGLVMLDCRNERSREYIVKPESWVMIQSKIAALPSSVRHVVVVATVPLIYPHIPLMESSLMGISGGVGCCAGAGRSLLATTGVSSNINNMFGEPEILDDLLDHWGSSIHVQEKKAMVQMLQEISKARAMRFTFLSGDVHVAGHGQFESTQNDEDHRHDHRFMSQVISSAIGNSPPPGNVVKALQWFSKSHPLDENTTEDMVRLGKSKILKDERNWCLVELRPFQAGSITQDGGLVFQIRLEHKRFLNKFMQTQIKPVEISVPVLDIKPDEQFDLFKLKPFTLSKVQSLADVPRWHLHGTPHWAP